MYYIFKFAVSNFITTVLSHNSAYEISNSFVQHFRIETKTKLNYISLVSFLLDHKMLLQEDSLLFSYTFIAF